jgi:hypothetical protein
LSTALKQWEEARKSDEDFLRIAKMQADANLASAAGLVKPVGKHLENENDATVVKKLFTMQVGEISEVLQVPAGLMCIKCVAVVPPEPNVKLDEKMKASLHTELWQKKLDAEIPKCFMELKSAAKPDLYLKGPPSVAEYREGVRNLVNQAGGPPPMPR